MYFLSEEGEDVALGAVWVSGRIEEEKQKGRGRGVIERVPWLTPAVFCLPFSIQEF